MKVSTGDKASDRSIKEIAKVPVFGFVNDIAIGPKAKFCVAAVGQEPRLGRWERVSGSKNRFTIVKLWSDSDIDDQSDSDVSE